MLRRANAVRGTVANAVRESAQEAADIARASNAWKDQSGKTRNSIRPVMRGAFRSAVTARGAAVFLESGTGKYGPKGTAYVIRARNAKALRFVVGGVTLFRRSVLHPGIKPTHFMYSAAEQQHPHFTYLCEQAIHQAVRR